MIRPVEPQHAAKPVVEWFLTLSNDRRVAIAKKAGVRSKKAKPAKKATTKKASAKRGSKRSAAPSKAAK